MGEQMASGNAKMKQTTDSTENSAGGKGADSLFSEPSHRRADARLIARAARWPMTPKRRAMLLEKADSWLHACKNAREFAAVAQIYLSAERQIQEDQQKAEENARLDAGKPTANNVHTLILDGPIRPQVEASGQRQLPAK